MRRLTRDTLSLAGHEFVIEAPAEALDLFRRLYPSTWRGEADDAAPFRLEGEGDRWRLRRGSRVVGPLRDALAAAYALEYEIETALVAGSTDRLALHAGGVGCEGRGHLIAGDAGAGKSTATLLLVELGHELLCEEVALVDPTTLEVTPHLRSVGIETAFLDRLSRWRTLRGGDVDRLDEREARYWPHRRCADPLPLETIFLPRFGASQDCGVTELEAAEALPEILGYCFSPPNADEEYFDRVIRVLESCRIVRVRFDGLETAQRLWRELLPPREAR